MVQFKEITLWELSAGRAPGRTKSNAKIYPQGCFKSKRCEICEKKFSPKSPCHRYCTETCASYARINNYYIKTYGISGAEALEMYNKQKGKCKICNGVGFKMNKGCKISLVLDHCHHRDVPRGWLCSNCNRALGLFKDDCKVMKEAIKYVNEY